MKLDIILLGNLIHNALNRERAKHNVGLVQFSGDLSLKLYSFMNENLPEEYTAKLDSDFESGVVYSNSEPKGWFNYQIDLCDDIINTPDLCIAKAISHGNLDYIINPEYAHHGIGVRLDNGRLFVIHLLYGKIKS
jgi:hypothetical protein